MHTIVPCQIQDELETLYKESRQQCLVQCHSQLTAKTHQSTWMKRCSTEHGHEDTASWLSRVELKCVANCWAIPSTQNHSGHAASPRALLKSMLRRISEDLSEWKGLSPFIESHGLPEDPEAPALPEAPSKRAGDAPGHLSPVPLRPHIPGRPTSKTGVH